LRAVLIVASCRFVPGSIVWTRGLLRQPLKVPDVKTLVEKLKTEAKVL
jgi:hypothetical protein